nr:hypothetical protein [Nesterenkonia xinjiangensis]
MNSTLISTSLLPTQRGGLDLGVEQDVEGLTGLTVHGIGLCEVEPVEERLGGDAAQRVIDAHVDRVTVTNQSQEVLQTGLGLLAVVLHRTLHIRDVHGLLLAVGALGVPPGTPDVRADHALADLGFDHDQQGPALAAVQTACEVVVMDLGLLSRGLRRS